MRTHLGCTGRIILGNLSRETQRRLEEVEATWLEFSPDPPSLVVRHVQPDAVSPPREIGGELLEFLTRVSDAERRAFPGGRSLLPGRTDRAVSSAAGRERRRPHRFVGTPQL